MALSATNPHNVLKMFFSNGVTEVMKNGKKEKIQIIFEENITTLLKFSAWNDKNNCLGILELFYQLEYKGKLVNFFDNFPFFNEEIYCYPDKYIEDSGQTTSSIGARIYIWDINTADYSKNMGYKGIGTALIQVAMEVSEFFQCKYKVMGYVVNGSHEFYKKMKFNFTSRKKEKQFLERDKSKEFEGCNMSMHTSCSKFWEDKIKKGRIFPFADIDNLS